MSDNSNTSIENSKVLIKNIFSKEIQKLLYYHACRVDIPDNNVKAEMLSEILGDEFSEIGTATNRMAYIYGPDEEREFKGGSGLVFEFALDRRG